MTESVVLRPCCHSKSQTGTAPQYIDQPDDRPVSIDKEDSRPARRITISELAPNYAIACHEAGHVAVALTLRATINTVTVLRQPHASINSIRLSLAERISVNMAGSIAERWSRRLIYRPGDDEIMEYVDRTRALRDGSCDDCEVARLLQVDTRHPKDNAPLLARYREIELATIDFVTHRKVWRIIEKLATALLERGTMSEDEINALIGADISALDVTIAF